MYWNSNDWKIILTLTHIIYCIYIYCTIYTVSLFYTHHRNLTCTHSNLTSKIWEDTTIQIKHVNICEPQWHPGVHNENRYTLNKSMWHKTSEKLCVKNRVAMHVAMPQSQKKPCKRKQHFTSPIPVPWWLIPEFPFPLSTLQYSFG